MTASELRDAATALTDSRCRDFLLAITNPEPLSESVCLRLHIRAMAPTLFHAHAVCVCQVDGQWKVLVGVVTLANITTAGRLAALLLARR